MAHLARLRHWVRWLDAQGVPPGHSALVLGIDQAEVEALAPWSGRGPEPRITGPPRIRRRPDGTGIFNQTGARVRILDRLDYDPGRIAAILAIRRADVIEFRFIRGKRAPLSHRRKSMFGHELAIIPPGHTSSHGSPGSSA